MDGGAMSKAFFWISHVYKCISFHEETGYQFMKCLDENDLKNQIYYYVDMGYKVQ